MVDFLFSLISFEGKRENLYQVILNSVEKHKSFVYKYPRKSLNALNKMPADLPEISKASLDLGRLLRETGWGACIMKSQHSGISVIQ